MVYPGLKSHPQHDVLRRLSNEGDYGAGGLLTLDLITTARANRLMQSLQNDHGFGLMAVSLGQAVSPVLLPLYVHLNLHHAPLTLAVPLRETRARRQVL